MPGGVSGQVFDIQRFCTDDGPGIRTTVFLKGCPLRCSWCHNPESWSAAPQLAYYSAKCTACGRCVSACTAGAVVNESLEPDRSKCLVCGECAQQCPSEARQVIGRTMSIHEVLAEVLRDETFYESSGGGVTLSGGEPLAQPEFAVAVLRGCRDRAVHTAVETSGFGAWETLREFAKLTDLFLFDLKIVDAAKHRRYCGVDDDLIITNARKLSAEGAPVVFRVPMVPGVNDGEDDLLKLAQLLKSLPRAHDLQLIPHHPIGGSKYEALGMDQGFAAAQMPESPIAQRDALLRMGLQVLDD